MNWLRLSSPSRFILGIDFSYLSQMSGADTSEKTNQPAGDIFGSTQVLPPSATAYFI
jgi:hypothetical protein